MLYRNLCSLKWPRCNLRRFTSLISSMSWILKINFLWVWEAENFCFKMNCWFNFVEFLTNIIPLFNTVIKKRWFKYFYSCIELSKIVIICWSCSIKFFTTVTNLHLQIFRYTSKRPLIYLWEEKFYGIVFVQQSSSL